MAIITSLYVILQSCRLTRSCRLEIGIVVRDRLSWAGETRRVPRPPPFNMFCHELSSPRQLQPSPAPIGRPPPRAFHHGRWWSSRGHRPVCQTIQYGHRFTEVAVLVVLPSPETLASEGYRREDPFNIKRPATLGWSHCLPLSPTMVITRWWLQLDGVSIYKLYKYMISMAASAASLRPI